MPQQSQTALCDRCTKPSSDRNSVRYGTLLCNECGHPPLTLKELNLPGDVPTTRTDYRSPHILTAIDQLNAIWNGEYDACDTITTLRREAGRMNVLADSMAKNLV